MRRTKYPSLGILDELIKIIIGFNPNPSANGLYESLPLDRRPSRARYSKILYQLDHTGYIHRTRHTLTITKKGQRKAMVRKLEQISLLKKRDGANRVIAFDIPEKMRHARDIIRSKLIAFECNKIQKSLYMTPYVCEEEIQEISRLLKVEPYVTVLKLAKSKFRRFNDRGK